MKPKAGGLISVQHDNCQHNLISLSNKDKNICRVPTVTSPKVWTCFFLTSLFWRAEFWRAENDKEPHYRVVILHHTVQLLF